jgi:hypothetical protein
MPLSIREFLDRLLNVTPSGDSRWMAQCPAHEDQRNSLSVKVGTRQPYVFFCHAGCPRESVLAALHLTWAEIGLARAPTNGPRPSRRPAATARTEVACYDYCGLDGALRYQVVRYAPKDFRQRRPDPDHPGGWVWNMDGVERVPYRLDEIAGFCRMGRTTVVIVEGEKDADACWNIGLPATTNAGGAGGWSEALSRLLKSAGVREVLVAPDNDEPGRAHAAQVIACCRAVGLVARLLVLDGLEAHGDASDFLAARGADAFRAAMVAAQTFTPLTAVHEVYAKWLGPEYDMVVLDVMLAAVASHWLDGDPCWVMIVGGPGAAKTETLQAVEGAGGKVLSQISSVAALLSSSPRRDRAADATGGILREIGDNGVLLIKDFTTMLEMHTTTRAELLSAFREIHDGKWSRSTGAEGGRRLDWHGRLTVVGACTSAWDMKRDAIAAMGDRFILVRFDTRYGRHAAFVQAHQNNGHEVQMRQELAQAVSRTLAQIDGSVIEPLVDADIERLYELANLVTLARTAVDVDYRQDVIQAYSAEMPTRFGKQLCQVAKGGMALGLSREDALKLAVRAARDSLPPLRWDVLHDVSIHPETRVADVRRRLEKVHNTVKRTLEALMVLGLVTVSGEDDEMRYTVKASVESGISAMSREASEPWTQW